jgi:hypothetical protein
MHRYELRNQVPNYLALRHACPYCSAKPGDQCWGRTPGSVRNSPHPIRKDLVLQDQGHPSVVL